MTDIARHAERSGLVARISDSKVWRWLHEHATSCSSAPPEQMTLHGDCVLAHLGIERVPTIDPLVTGNAAPHLLDNIGKVAI